MIAKKELRKFGLVAGSGFIALALFVLFVRGAVRTVFLGVGFVLVLAGLVAPQLLATLYKGWMFFGKAMGWFMTRLILVLLFYLVVTPLNFFARLVGKRFLDLGYNVSATTYWCARGKGELSKEKWENQF